MKPILMENAFEAWRSAIYYCNAIKDGKATLQYQKNFVTSFHNAVELIMKQMLLNNNDHRVARIIKKTEVAEKMCRAYNETKDLNKFFSMLSDEELLLFHTITFNDLIPLHKELFKSSSEFKGALEKEFKLLQRLRNSETHFVIRQDVFLSEKDFCILHNFMLAFYRIMYTWCPKDRDNVELYILPYWGDPDGVDCIYEFSGEFLKKFSYEKAVRNSKLAKEIARLLNNDGLCGAPEFSSYTITRDLVNLHEELIFQFDEIWAIVYMMQNLGFIVVDEILDDEQGKVYFSMNVVF